ncbi:hypothetical protein SLA2020_382160 [Shorea laevis]
MSSTISYTFAFFCLLFFFSTMADARIIPSSAPSTIVRPLVSDAKDFATIKPPRFRHKHPVFQGTEVKNCLPKGFRHSSAPSRFVNYHTLGSPECSSDSHSTKP